MDQEQWNEVNRIVDDALQIDKEERKAFVEQLCGNNPELLTMVTELLDSIAESRTQNFLERDEDYPSHLAAILSRENEGTPASAMIGETVGRYEILELIGHGGMSSVFLAQRADRAYEQTVALKLMRRGMDTPSNKSRFRRERNILAKLDHPNIARLLDGGVTGDGLPYLVMEYVEGTQLHDYCDRHRLSIQKRLELFKSVCKAIRHAHANAVIHRDLKPSNILVTENAEVKVLDFGIAKLLEPEKPAATTLQTRTGARLLTVTYAAPEQIEGKPVTTASDTYTMGILLYELLTGVHPFSRDGNRPSKIAQAKNRRTPVTPGKSFEKLDTSNQKEIAGLRSTRPVKLLKILQGDLDAIAMKALRKEPEARYGSADQLLEDLRRREKNRPIVARKDTLRYKTSRFIKRHKTGLGIVVGFLILALAFAGFYTWQITNERNRARQEAQKNRQISNFLVNIFKSANPNVAEGDTLTARELLNRGLQKVNRLESPVVKSEMLTILGQSYTGLGDYQTASELFKKALNLSEQSESGNFGIAYATAAYNMGTMLMLRQDFEESVPYLKKAYAIQSRELGPSDRRTIRSLARLGISLRNTGKLDSAEIYVRKALVLQNSKAKSSSDSLLPDIKKDLAYILRKKGSYEEAERLYKDVLAETESDTSSNLSDRIQLYNNIAYLHQDQEQYDAAEKYYSKALKSSAGLRGASHPLTNMIRSNFATALMVGGKLQEAKNLFLENIRQAEKRYSENHWRTGNAHTTAGYFLIRNQMNYDTAKSYIKDGVQIYGRVLGPNHTWTAYAKGLLAAVEYLLGNHRRADSLFTVHYKIYKRQRDSLDRTNRGQIDKLMNIYIPENDTLARRYVSAYRDILE